MLADKIRFFEVLMVQSKIRSDSSKNVKYRLTGRLYYHNKEAIFDHKLTRRFVIM